jgi:hypothetical protein
MSGATIPYDRDAAHSPERTAFVNLFCSAGRGLIILQLSTALPTQGIVAPLKNSVHRLFRRATEPQILFPFIGVFLLTVVWVSTFGILRVKRAAAEHTAAISSRDLLDTYEAQVVRALHEIDQTLSLVMYLHDRSAGAGLAELRDKGLLPPDLLFVVSIADHTGAIVDSTRAIAGQNVASQDYFRAQLSKDSFFIGQPALGPTGNAKLQFSHRLTTPDGKFDGVVIVAVDADYFVSAYEPAQFGQHGILGLLGTDGVFRVRRTGEAIFSGDKIDYAAVVPGPDAIEADAKVSTNSWDRVRRYTSARELYGFPLAVLVGLSAEEQDTAAEADQFTYLWWALLASALIVPITGLLGYMNWQLGQSRLRESEAILELAQRTEYLAYHDGLTGLPNRSMFSKLLDSEHQLNHAATTAISPWRFSTSTASSKSTTRSGMRPVINCFKAVAARLQDLRARQRYGRALWRRRIRGAAA